LRSPASSATAPAVLASTEYVVIDENATFAMALELLLKDRRRRLRRLAVVNSNAGILHALLSPSRLIDSLHEQLSAVSCTDANENDYSRCLVGLLARIHRLNLALRVRLYVVMCRCVVA
jgi:hypothetical protein